MKPMATLLSLPVSVPIGALGWLARRIAEAAEREAFSPEARAQRLIALERELEAGEIDLETFEAEEARLAALDGMPQAPA